MNDVFEALLNMFTETMRALYSAEVSRRQTETSQQQAKERSRQIYRLARYYASVIEKLGETLRNKNWDASNRIDRARTIICEDYEFSENRLDAPNKLEDFDDLEEASRE